LILIGLIVRVDLESILDEVRTECEKYFNARDFEGMVNKMYTPDCTYLAPGCPPRHGRKGNQNIMFVFSHNEYCYPCFVSSDFILVHCSENTQRVIFVFLNYTSITAVIEGLKSSFTEDICSYVTSSIAELLDGGDIAVDRGTFTAYNTKNEKTAEGK